MGGRGTALTEPENRERREEHLLKLLIKWVGGVGGWIIDMGG